MLKLHNYLPPDITFSHFLRIRNTQQQKDQKRLKYNRDFSQTFVN